MMKLSMISAALVATTVALTGCKDEDKKYNPEIGPVIKVDGCDVKYVDRGSTYSSFWIARCEQTATVTGMGSSGKSSFPVATIIATEDAVEAAARKAAAERQEKYAAARAKFEKLSVEERQLLGIVMQQPAK